MSTTVDRLLTLALSLEVEDGYTSERVDVCRFAAAEICRLERERAPEVLKTIADNCERVAMQFGDLIKVLEEAYLRR
jgi:S-adenosylmethionine:diacylglycerol 3-amino-3-carboxypropyl transferase